MNWFWFRKKNKKERNGSGTGIQGVHYPLPVSSNKKTIVTDFCVASECTNCGNFIRQFDDGGRAFSCCPSCGKFKTAFKQVTGKWEIEVTSFKHYNTNKYLTFTKAWDVT